MSESERPLKGGEDGKGPGVVEVCIEAVSEDGGHPHAPAPSHSPGPDTDAQAAQEAGVETSTSAATASDSACVSDAAQVPSPADDDVQVDSPKDPSESTDGASSAPRPEPVPDKDKDSGVDRDQEEACSERKGPSSDIAHNREFQAVKLAAVQLLAIKTLSSVVTCGRFRELLLVPRATPQPDGSQEKSLLEDLAAQKDEDLKSAVRSIMRHLVHRATMPSPFRRVVSLSELERSFAVLHTDIIRTMAEEQLGLPVAEGQSPHLWPVCLSLPALRSP